MDIFIKIIGIVIGAAFLFFGIELIVRGKNIIQAIQKRKFGQTAQPRPQELLMTKILGGLLILAGIYYAGVAIVSLF